MGILKKLIAVTSVLFSLCAVSFAEQISFQIVQLDTSRTDISDKSYEIENNVLDGFFNYGFIVTNSSASIAEIEEEKEPLWKSGLGEAFSGFSDYFVQISIFYEKTDETRTTDANIEKVEWTVASAKTGLVLGKATIENIVLKNGKEDLGAIAANLVKNINKAIRA